MDALFGAFGLDGRLLLIQVVNFGILIVALYFFLYKPVLKILEERRHMVAKAVEDAKQASTVLASADTEAAERIQKADTEAMQVLTLARKAADDERTRLIQDAEARATMIAHDAESRSQEASTKMLRESEKEIARLAILAAEKIIRKS